MSGPDRDDASALLARVRRRARERVARSSMGMRGELARGHAVLGAVVERHPLWCAGGAVGIGLLGVVLLRRRAPPAPLVPTTAPPLPGVVRRLVIGVVLPSIRRRLLAAVAQR